MRGDAERQADIMLAVTPDSFAPAEHPIRRIKLIVDAALQRLAPLFDTMYARGGRPSIPPEHLLKASLLIAPRRRRTAPGARPGGCGSAGAVPRTDPVTSIATALGPLDSPLTRFFSSPLRAVYLMRRQALRLDNHRVPDLCQATGVVQFVEHNHRVPHDRVHRIAIELEPMHHSLSRRVSAIQSPRRRIVGRQIRW